FTVQQNLSVEFARPPTVEDCSEGRVIDLQEICYNAQVGRKRNNCANVEVAIGPSIQPVANSPNKGVINCWKARGTRNTQPTPIPILIERAEDAYHGISFE